MPDDRPAATIKRTIKTVDKQQLSIFRAYPLSFIKHLNSSGCELQMKKLKKAKETEWRVDAPLPVDETHRMFVV